NALRGQYGRLIAPKWPKSAFELLIWERVAYLTTDGKRAAAFELFRKRVGLSPSRVLTAPRSIMVDVLATGGMGASDRADQLVEAAQLVIGEFDGDLDEVCERPVAEAKRHLKRFH